MEQVKESSWAGSTEKVFALFTLFADFIKTNCFKDSNCSHCSLFAIFELLYYYNLWSARLRKIPQVAIDSEWPKIMFNISLQLQQTPALFPRKNLENREPP